MRKGFVIGMILYAVIFLALLSVGLVFFWNFMDAFEQSRPVNTVKAYVAELTKEEIEARDIQYGVCFGPVLISNGEVVLAENNVGGLNPRTAIGQRADGAVLLLVIDGRQVSSLGASYEDLIREMLSYGAVNAANLDGGSSSLMYYQGKYVNAGFSVVGPREIPTAFVVK